MTSRLMLGSLALMATVGCGSDGSSLSTSPSAVQTQAMIQTNQGWRFSASAVQPMAGENTNGKVIDIGNGYQCASAQMTLYRIPEPVNPSVLALTVGQNTATTHTANELLTVCGSGPVSPRDFPK